MDCTACDSISEKQSSGALLACALAVIVVLLVIWIMSRSLRTSAAKDGGTPVECQVVQMAETKTTTTSYDQVLKDNPECPTVAPVLTCPIGKMPTWSYNVTPKPTQPPTQPADNILQWFKSNITQRVNKNGTQIAISIGGWSYTGTQTLFTDAFQVNNTIRSTNELISWANGVKTQADAIGATVVEFDFEAQNASDWTVLHDSEIYSHLRSVMPAPKYKLGLCVGATAFVKCAPVGSASSCTYPPSTTYPPLPHDQNPGPGSGMGIQVLQKYAQYLDYVSLMCYDSGTDLDPLACLYQTVKLLQNKVTTTKPPKTTAPNTCKVQMGFEIGSQFGPCKKGAVTGGFCQYNYGQPGVNRPQQDVRYLTREYMKYGSRFGGIFVWSNDNVDISREYMQAINGVLFDTSLKSTSEPDLTKVPQSVTKMDTTTPLPTGPKTPGDYYTSAFYIKGWGSLLGLSVNDSTIAQIPDALGKGEQSFCNTAFLAFSKPVYPSTGADFWSGFGGMTGWIKNPPWYFINPKRNSGGGGGGGGNANANPSDSLKCSGTKKHSEPCKTGECGLSPSKTYCMTCDPYMHTCV